MREGSTLAECNNPTNSLKSLLSFTASLPVASNQIEREIEALLGRQRAIVKALGSLRFFVAANTTASRIIVLTLPQ
jgi:hypothetical protein